MLPADLRTQLHDRLTASRARLLAALEGVTERDFGSDVGGETIVQMLARIASEERAAVASATGDMTSQRAIEKPLPPQVIHALVGARYRTARYLDSSDAEAGTASAMVAAAEQREREAAGRIAARPELKPLPPPPEIPVVHLPPMLQRGEAPSGQ